MKLKVYSENVTQTDVQAEESSIDELDGMSQCTDCLGCLTVIGCYPSYHIEEFLSVTTL